VSDSGRAGDVAAPPLLTVSDVTVRFGGIRALDRVTFSVAAGEVCGLIGPNGAGKTTVFNCLSRIYEPVSGDIRFDGTSLLAAPAHGVATRGISRTFQNLALFERLSVLDNVLIGGHARGRAGFWQDTVRAGRSRREEQRLRARAREWLIFVGLAQAADEPVATLPFGSRKRVELARALLAEPRLLLLDEPAAGLSPEEARTLEHLVRDVRDRFGVTILLVEHRMALVMAICDHLVVLDFGRTIADGPPTAVARDPAVVQAYLGAES
jgi:branched-chain amino acid transport system ATP-binding protein